MKQSLTSKCFLLGLFIVAVFSFGSEDVLAAPPAPSVSPSCSGTGLSISMSSPGAGYYALRVDNLANTWSGNCAAENSNGNACGNVSSPFTHSYTSASSVSYHVWAHACTWSGDCSAPTHAYPTCSPPVALPTISSFTSSVSTVPSTGGSVTFNWSSNAASCSTSWAGGSFPASGSSGPHWITSTANYTLTCTNASGSTSRTISVTALAPPVPSISSFTSSVSTVPSTGGSVTFNWSSNAASCSTSWAGGSFPASGSSGPHWITSTANYTLTCTNASGSTSRTISVTALAPVLSAPTGLTITPNPTNENRATVSWNAVTGAAYYSVRVDNNSDSWKYTNDSSSPYYTAGMIDDCNNDTVDGAILQNGVFAGPTNYTPGVDSCGNINRTSVEVQLVANSYNHIWVHSRGSDHSWSPMAQISVALAPPSPSGLTATCDAAGNTTVSWNAVPVPGGFDPGVRRHYSFRLDNQRNSSQFEASSYPANNVACVNDDVNNNSVLARSSGVGTDYCGNMRNTSWTGVINPSGTQRAWVHTKSWDFLTFGNRPPSEIEFTCPSGGPITYVCTGTVPLNATMYPNDNVGLTANTPYTYWPTDTGTRCQYSCNAGSTWDVATSSCVGGGGGAVNGVCGVDDGVLVSSAPTDPGLCSSGTATPVTGSVADGGWNWFCNGSGGGTNSGLCSAPYLSAAPFTIMICQNSCTGGFRRDGGSFSIPLVGSPVNLLACIGNGGSCNSPSNQILSVASNPATWDDLESPDNVVSLSDPSLASVVVTPGAVGSEDIELTAAGYGTVSTRADVTCLPTATCTAQETDHCNGEPFTVYDAACNININCTGTRSCDYNWKEVAP